MIECAAFYLLEFDAVDVATSRLDADADPLRTMSASDTDLQSMSGSAALASYMETVTE